MSEKAPQATFSNEPGKLTMSGKKPSLGRGLAELSPLLAQRDRVPLPESPSVAGDRLTNLPLDLLQRGKYQPRVDMRPETLSELADRNYLTPLTQWAHRHGTKFRLAAEHRSAGVASRRRSCPHLVASSETDRQLGPTWTARRRWCSVRPTGR